MANFTGTPGHDYQKGTTGDDDFDYSQGGRDTLLGRGGSDVFHMGDTLAANDKVDGGNGVDYMDLDAHGGSYTVTLQASTIKNIETLEFQPGNYNITLNDGNVAAGAQFAILGSAATSLHIDGSAETDGRFFMNTSSGNDVFIGGAQGDYLDGGSPYFAAGRDIVQGNAGNDIFSFFDDLTAADRAYGGSGYDTLTLDGDNSAGVTLGPHTIAGIEEIDFDAHHGVNTYVLKLNDGNVAAGQTLTIMANTAFSATVNGAAETDGRFVFVGGDGIDSFIGGNRNDRIEGGGAHNSLTGRGGRDVFVYEDVLDSTGLGYDDIHGFNAKAEFVRRARARDSPEPRAEHRRAQQRKFRR